MQYNLFSLKFYLAVMVKKLEGHFWAWGVASRSTCSCVPYSELRVVFVLVCVDHERYEALSNGVEPWGKQFCRDTSTRSWRREITPWQDMQSFRLVLWPTFLLFETNDAADFFYSFSLVARSALVSWVKTTALGVDSSVGRGYSLITDHCSTRALAFCTPSLAHFLL